MGAAAALAVMTAPSTAQQVMSEPGYCAFFYPNANCQNKGPGNPYTGDAWLRLNQGYSHGYYLPNSGQTVGVARSRARRSVTRMQ
ncbi:hypothetical protein CQ12_21825 [Bradyrhizobium jicamae]|uniref:Uncharacterized protein n=1 Tax=Bradyrhizobium jicamae TaxID=280332 RepID=A0A0R3LU55_9BRAD|nr:hypothetical protein CQ12_21825 [Bradyrhizobium jicamae]